MNLLITSGIFPPEIGGPATYVHSLSHWLWKKKISVRVVTALKGELTESYPFPVQVVKKRGLLLWHVKVFLKIWQLLKDADVLYINGLPSESCSAALLRRKKCIYRVSGDLVWERAVRKKWTDKSFVDFQEQGEKGSIKVKFLRAYRKFCLNRVDKIIAPSLFLAKVVENWGIKKEKIVVVHNPYSPVEEEKFSLPVEGKDKFIITTGGRLVPWKGVAVVMRAVKEVKKSFLIILGDGPERKNLETLGRDLEIKERIFFTGIIPRPELKYLFSKSDCFVLNSKYEGLPHIVLEAMAAGCPVIASNLGGSPEIIRHNENGLLIEPDDETALVRCITRLRSDGGLKKTLAVNGQRTVQQDFDLDRLFQRVGDIIQECVR